ncbi:MAG: sulfatase-like hydrolase/transferase [Verrucomicrobia bacterium]|nr:sulfatase-like hydrolase/transferase [Verrucomicrobiota bacterium]
MKTIVVLTVLLAAATLADAARKPNVIVILADDMGYADVGFNGCKDIPTPHIDSLAAHGVRCSSGYVSHSFCSPTRAGLMTGRYQQRFGHENNPAWLPEDTKVGLPVNQTTIADVMKSAGFVTGAIGKWHLGAAPCFHPNERGFVEYFGFLGGGHIYLPGLKGGVEYTVPLLRNKEPLELKEYMTDVLSREAAAFVARHKTEPFYLYVAYNAVHTPLQAPGKYLSRFTSIADERRRAYAAMTSAMDDGIGLILRALRDNGLERDTLVWFFSDNGGPPYNVSPTHNDPLRGNKGTLYEGGIRVPFVVQWRGELPEGTVYEQPVISLDVLPTAATLAGAKLPGGLKLDGVNIVPHLKGESKGPPHERLFWRTGGGAAWAVREGRYKLLKPGKDAALQLFDLNSDIGEAKDIVSEKPDVVARLQKAHDAWNTELIPPLFESPKPAAKKKARQAGRTK